MWDWLEQAQTLKKQAITFVIVTVISVKGSSPRDEGAKLIVCADGRFFGTIGGGQLEAQVIKDAQACLEEVMNQTKPYPLCFRTGQCCGGAVEVFMEVFGVGPELYLFGAGHVGQAVCQVLAGTPFAVHLIDSRAEWINHPNIPAQVIRHEESWDSFLEKTRWHADRTYVAVMTHDHALDEEIIARVITKPARYVGLIGSRTKWQRFERLLSQRGLNEDEIGRVFCPLGIPMGGKAPKEVAVSLAAQLLRVFYGESEEKNS